MNTTDESLWIKCDSCKEIIEKSVFEHDWRVCRACGHHHYLPAFERVAMLCDDKTFEELDEGVTSADPLKFFDSKTYQSRLDTYAKKTNRYSAIVSGTAKLDSKPIEIAVMDFSYIGGSLGSAEGEKLTRSYERSLMHKRPIIIVSSSGGARMQESIFSLMQMAKTCAMITKLQNTNIPYISLLTDPTTGGVTASYAMMGDVHIAEPNALIGFAGPRVIKQTIGADLPEGFQRSEYLLKHGMIDRICERKNLKAEISRLLSLMGF